MSSPVGIDLLLLPFLYFARVCLTHAKDSSASHLVSGRSLPLESNKADILNLARSKYEECRLNHISCRASEASSFTPTRLLDLTGLGTMERFVRVLTVPSSFNQPYAALSYCWGKSLNVRLTTDGFHLFTSKGKPCDELPATIRDACDLCYEIGIQYIWVCSLCIIQDSEHDWLEQSSTMGDLYNSAEITISAAGSDDCSTGLYHRRAPEALSTATLGWRGPGGTTGSCSVRSRMIHSGFKEPTESRGWTLQETLVSKRLLTLGSFQLSWQCATGNWNESGTSLRAVDYMAEEFPCPSLHYPIPLYDGGRANLRADSRSGIGVWGELVRTYCHRSLTLPKDKLPAISGLAKWMSRTSHAGDRYVAGLWWSQMPNCLLWYNQLMFPAEWEDAMRPTTYRAPWWSWASIDSEFFDWLNTAPEEVHARALECELSYKSDSIFGEVQAGILTLEAPSKRGWLIPNRPYPESFDFWGDDWQSEVQDSQGVDPEDALGRVRVDLYTEDDVKRSGTQHVLDSVRQCECLRITSNFGILVRESNSSRDADEHPPLLRRRRLGIVHFKYNKSHSWWADAPRRLIHFERWFAQPLLKPLGHSCSSLFKYYLPSIYRLKAFPRFSVQQSADLEMSVV